MALEPAYPLSNVLFATFELKIRDLLIFDGNLIHKSNPNKSKKCRVVGITRLAAQY